MLRMVAILAACLCFCSPATAAPPEVDLRAYLQLEGVEGDDASLFVQVFGARDRGDALRLSDALLQRYHKATGKKSISAPMLVLFIFPAAPEDGSLIGPLCYKVLHEVQLDGVDEFSIRFQRSSSQPENTATVVGLVWDTSDGHDEIVAMRETFRLKNDSWLSVSLDKVSKSSEINGER